MAERPQVHELDWHGLHWFLVTAVYPTQVMARMAWERLDRKLQRPADDELGAGFYRHGHRDTEGKWVTVVTMDPDRARRAARLLYDGEEANLSMDTATQLVRRRATVLLSAPEASAGGGRRIVRHPEGRGATLVDGQLIEPPPPRG